MNNIALASDRAQYAVALQHEFITGAEAGARLPRPLPAGITSGALNILDPSSPFLHTPVALVSWGQYMSSSSLRAPGIVGSRDRARTTIIGDSGGYQFKAKPGAYLGRATVVDSVRWLEENADLAMTLDIPTDTIGMGRWASFQSCLTDTLANLAVTTSFRSNSGTRFLNVLQGDGWSKCRAWYDAVKAYPFEGWAFGGGSRTLPMMLRLIGKMIEEDRLGSHLHVLGTSSAQRAVELSAIKKALRARGYDIEITFDTASPSLSLANNRVAAWLDVSSTAFKTAYHRLCVDPDLAGSTLAFPYNDTHVGKRVTMGDLMVRGGLAQSGPDTTARVMLVHHNIEQLLRCLEQANRLADLMSKKPVIAPRLRTHSQKSTVAARAMADRKTVGHRS